MNSLEKKLKELDSSLYSKLQETKDEINHLLGKFSFNFPTYTDHSINHTQEVFKIASEIIEDELCLLDADEIYILSMASLLHDVGMCIPEEKIKSISQSQEILSYKAAHPNLSIEEFIRDIHHELSNKFILEEWELLKIPTAKYAKAIGLVAQGHRKVDLGNFDIYEPRFFAKSGKEFVCLPYLACILRIADELDVTNSRTPKLLTKYYMPNNEQSVNEWAKHIATSQRNYGDNEVIFEVDCSDQNIYAALQDQFDKIQNVINSCQKVIRSIPSIAGKKYYLPLSKVNVNYAFLGFDPKGIKFSFDVQNVVTAFIGEDLYKNKMTALREGIQNAIDSCMYKSKVLKEIYNPYIKVAINTDSIVIEDNGAGMDEFIIENFFGRLASSFYEQEKIKNQFEAIGQFGVGVFSYFLLSEYIDIETKTINSPALKFRFDKDPKSYFHFYDKVDRQTPGTTITMYIKKDLQETVEKKSESYIKKFFKHVEVPIELDISGTTSIIKSPGFEIDSKKEIKDRLKLPYKKHSEDFEIRSAYINNEDLEGICGLIIEKNYLKVFSDRHSIFDHEQFLAHDPRSTMSHIAVAQKGVFVSNYPSSAISFFIGEINLKKKLKINIDRNGFTDEGEIFQFISHFEIKILEELFPYLMEKCVNNEERLNISNDFLQNFLNYHRQAFFLQNLYIGLLKKYLYVSIIFNGENSIEKMEDFIEKFREFVLVTGKADGNSISAYFKIPALVIDGGKYDGAFQDLVTAFNGLEYDHFVDSFKGVEYLILKKSIYSTNEKETIEKLGSILNTYNEFVKGDSKKVFFNIWLNKGDDREYYNDDYFVNYNHAFFQFLSSNLETIKGHPEYLKIVKSAYLYIREHIISDKVDAGFVRKLNEIIQPLNQIAPIKKFTNSDFK